MKSKRHPKQHRHTRVHQEIWRITLLATICVVLFIIIGLIPSLDNASDNLSPHVPMTHDSKPPQFVLLAFDGSQSLTTWQETRDFAKEMAKIGKPVFFTYFVSGVYFLTEDNRFHYQPPNAPAGSSLIGFADSPSDINARVQQINGSVLEGHEIASHANGHFNGADWSLDQWNQELDSFSDLLFHTQENNPGLVLSEPLMINPNDMVGFRAPLLGANDALDQSLALHNYRYDASHISSGKDWPEKNRHGVWEFPLATITLPQGQQTISMDYSIFVLQSGGHNIFNHTEPGWKTNHDELLAGYKNYFEQHYYGNRAPVFIGHHFSKWNDGLYWEVMKDLAQEVCGLPDVRCTTHRSLADYLDARVLFATNERSSER